MENPPCSWCERSEAVSKCGGCGEKFFCSSKCQADSPCYLTCVKSDYTVAGHSKAEIGALWDKVRGSSGLYKRLSMLNAWAIAFATHKEMPEPQYTSEFREALIDIQHKPHSKKLSLTLKQLADMLIEIHEKPMKDSPSLDAQFDIVSSAWSDHRKVTHFSKKARAEDQLLWKRFGNYLKGLMLNPKEKASFDLHTAAQTLASELPSESVSESFDIGQPPANMETVNLHCCLKTVSYIAGGWVLTSNANDPISSNICTGVGGGVQANADIIWGNLKLDAAWWGSGRSCAFQMNSASFFGGCTNINLIGDKGHWVGTFLGCGLGFGFSVSAGKCTFNTIRFGTPK